MRCRYLGHGKVPFLNFFVARHKRVTGKAIRTKKKKDLPVSNIAPQASLSPPLAIRNDHYLPAAIPVDVVHMQSHFLSIMPLDQVEEIVQRR